MTSIANIELRYLHSELAASDDTPTQYTADGGNKLLVQDSALTEANDYWNGSLIRWDSGLNADSGLWSNVEDFTASNDRAHFSEALPERASSGDLYTLFRGGKHASSVRVLGLRTAPLVNVTGFSVTHVAPLNGEGTGTLRFSLAGESLSWQPPGESEGVAVRIADLAENDTVLLHGGGTTDQQESKFILLTRSAAALPAADATDDISLDLVLGSFLAPITAAEAAAGITIYRPVAVRNTGLYPATAVAAYCAEPFPGAASTTLSAVLGTGAGTLRTAGLDGWGAHGWIYNVTQDDLRYYYDRSGSSATILNPSGGHRGFTAASWAVDDVLEPYPWMDIGLDAPGALDVFEDPADRETAPSGVVFSCPTDAGSGLSIGTLAASGVHAIWMRFEIPAGFRPIEGGRVDLRVYAEVIDE